MTLALAPPGPISVIELFGPERRALLDLLDGLPAGSWDLPTACEGWSVKDIAAHILGDDLGRLSRHRDGHRSGDREARESLVAFIDRNNARWVEAMRILSPGVLRELLESSGQETEDFFRTLDPDALGPPVSWAGPDPAPVWLDLAREYTERWHHHQQVREAVGVPLVSDPSFMRPVLATYAFALPKTFEGIDRPVGTTVSLVIDGPSGGAWAVFREPERWRLFVGDPGRVDAAVRMGQDTAWRLFTKGLSPSAAEGRAQLSGDSSLARRVLTTVAIVG